MTNRESAPREASLESATAESHRSAALASGQRPRAPESHPRPRVGRAVTLTVIKSEIGAARGFPTAAEIAHHCGWRNESSALDALSRLESDGHIRRAGRETTGKRRTIWELTSTGAAPASKRCENWCSLEPLPASAFWPSRHTADGLTRICKACIAKASEQGRREREARARPQEAA